MKRIITAATACLALLVGSGAQAHETVVLPTEIVALDAAVADGAVAVSGDVAFGGQTIQDLGSDAAGDHTGGAATSPLGVDLTGAQIHWPDPDRDELLFEIRVAELPPAPLDGTPETLQYNWDFTVDGTTSWSLKIMRTRVSATQADSAYGALFECVPSDSGFSCSEQVRLSEVEFRPDDGVVRAGVSLAQMGAKRGSVVSSWDRTGSGALWTGASAGGQQTLIATYDAMSGHASYTVPLGRSVVVGIAPSGEEVEPAHLAVLDADDLFTAQLDLPSEAGTYTVAAEACFADNCATGTVDVEVAP